MNATPASADVAPPRSQSASPIQATSNRNVPCTYRPMPATVPSFQDHFMSERLPVSQRPSLGEYGPATPGPLAAIPHTPLGVGCLRAGRPGLARPMYPPGTGRVPAPQFLELSHGAQTPRPRRPAIGVATA